MDTWRSWFLHDDYRYWVSFEETESYTFALINKITRSNNRKSHLELGERIIFKSYYSQKDLSKIKSSHLSVLDIYHIT